jgi:pimeloyl-ACP methyl ester carboxylesterase
MQTVATLIYLDALGNLDVDPPADKEWAQLQHKLPPGLQPARTCAPADLQYVCGLPAVAACDMAFAMPESELRQGFERIDGRVRSFKTPVWVNQAISQAHTGLQAGLLEHPSASPGVDEWRDDYGGGAEGHGLPAEERRRASGDRSVHGEERIVFGRWTEKLKRHVPDARVVYFPTAGHYIFLTREAEILRETRGFVAALGKA